MEKILFEGNGLIELPIETQIRILENARNVFTYNLYCRGLCYVLDCEIRLLIKMESFCGYEYIEKLIPLFTRENARNSVGIDSECMTGYWWFIKNRQKRIEFLDWMVSQLENKVNID